MDLTRLSLNNPIAVIVGLLLLLMFGCISLYHLPVQLTPDLQPPEITIRTIWPGAAPSEVETEIVKPQEDVLSGLPGATKLLAGAQQGRADVSITFSVETDFLRALVEVVNRLNQITDYPDDADEPIISTVGQNARAIAWFIIRTTEGNARDISSYQDYVDDVVKERFQQVPGVASSDVVGGREQEIRVTFDPYKVAGLGIQIPEAMATVSAGRDISGGYIDIGKNQYSLRYIGKFQLQDLQDLVVDWRQGSPVYLKDIAVVERRLVDKDSFVITKGGVSIAVNAQREVGVNIFRVMNGLKKVADDLSKGPLAREGLTIEQVYDETVYISDSITTLVSNLLIGISLAISVLWLFLRKIRATLIIALAIPACLLCSFFILNITGRTINVVSLTGLTFSVGMVLDASIIVLENIIRLRTQGKSMEVSSLTGTTQVWGALLASTITTVAVFLPIVFIEGEVGQLFGDLAIAIVSAICVSLIVAITAIPGFSKSYLDKYQFNDPYKNWWPKASKFLISLSDTPARRLFWIITLVTSSMAITWWLLPKADYLPEGNRNLVFGYILPPPGANIEQIEKEMGNVIAERISPYLTGAKQPQIKHYFFVSSLRGVFIGARASNANEIGKLVPVLNNIVQGFPDSIAFARRASLFSGLDDARSIDMDLQGRDVAELVKVAAHGFSLIRDKMPGARIRPYPGLELAQPELQLYPNERRILEAGWYRDQMGGIIRTLGDGLYIGDYFTGDEILDVVVRAKQWRTIEELKELPLVTPSQGILPLRELFNIQRTAGPEEIRRINKRRTVTLEITPPANMSLEEALDILHTQVEPVLREEMPADSGINYTGTADKIVSLIDDMRSTFILAILILYLLMSVLFRSFKDSLLVILTIPLSIVGGVIALKAVNTIPQKIFGSPIFQPMDMLTMIGFIILLGLVVNNAILLVHQARSGERNGLSRRAAVLQAIDMRLRPILMSTSTSVFGMLPLLLVVDSGSELYRGLAAVIVGGVIFSTIFTMVLLPSVLRIGETKS